MHHNSASVPSAFRIACPSSNSWEHSLENSRHNHCIDVCSTCSRTFREVAPFEKGHLVALLHLDFHKIVHNTDRISHNKDYIRTDHDNRDLNCNFVAVDRNILAHKVSHSLADSNDRLLAFYCIFQNHHHYFYCCYCSFADLDHAHALFLWPRDHRSDCLC